MSDLISRKRIEFELCESNMPKKYRDFCRRVINSESLSPTIDAEPVRHGHWVATSDPKENVFGAVRYLCSVCDDVVYLNPLKIDQEKHCRCCGAKMDEVMLNE